MRLGLNEKEKLRLNEEELSDKMKLNDKKRLLKELMRMRCRLKDCEMLNVQLRKPERR